MNASSSDFDPVFSIADLAQEMDITTRTIRFYNETMSNWRCVS